MKDVFVTNEGIVISNNVFYPGDCACHWQQCSNFESNSFTNVWPYKNYSQCVCITHEYGWFYAHFIVDFLPRILAVPMEILNSSNFIMTTKMQPITDAFDAIGIDNKKIIYLNPEEVIHAETLYTVAPIECTKFQTYLLLNMRKIMAEKFNLDKAKPNLYIVYNRENTEFRVMENHKKVLSSIKKKYPQFPWQNSLIPKSLGEQFKFFNTIKVFIAIHGAAFSNTLFMQPKTAVCEVQVDRWVDNYLWITMIADVYHVIYRDKRIHWRESGRKNYLEIPSMLEMAEKALKAIGDI